MVAVKLVHLCGCVLWHSTHFLLVLLWMRQQSICWHQRSGRCCHNLRQSYHFAFKSFYHKISEVVQNSRIQLAVPRARVVVFPTSFDGALGPTFTLVVRWRFVNLIRARETVEEKPAVMCTVSMSENPNRWIKKRCFCCLCVLPRRGTFFNNKWKGNRKEKKNESRNKVSRIQNLVN